MELASAAFLSYIWRIVKASTKSNSGQVSAFEFLFRKNAFWFFFFSNSKTRNYEQQFFFKFLRVKGII